MKGKEARIVFMGTPEFAVASLDALVSSGYKVAGVVTAPDRPAGRGQKLTGSAVSDYAVSKGLKTLKPEKLKDPVFLGELKSLEADLQVVVAFRMLPEVVWHMPPLGTFNLHASLLPQYRGAAPLNWVLINGERETGVTTFLLDQQIDTGRIIFREPMAIGDEETAGELHDRLMESGAKLILKTVDALAEGTIEPVDQSHVLQFDAALRHAPKIFRENCRISWAEKAEPIRNLIRGLSPYPAAWTTLVNRKSKLSNILKIYFATKEVESHSHEPGFIVSDNRSFLKIACADGWICVANLQAEGRKRMKTEEFLRGFPPVQEFTAT